MNFLILILIPLTVFAESLVFNLGYSERARSDLIITASGDFPMYSMELSGGDQSVFFSDPYMAMMALDICKAQGRVPRKLSKSDKLVEGRLHYIIDFKCENRDETVWQELTSEYCTHYTGEDKLDPHFKKICQRLERYGKTFLQCKHRDHQYDLWSFPDP